MFVVKRRIHTNHMAYSFPCSTTPCVYFRPNKWGLMEAYRYRHKRSHKNIKFIYFATKIYFIINCASPFLYVRPSLLLFFPLVYLLCVYSENTVPPAFSTGCTFGDMRNEILSLLVPLREQTTLELSGPDKSLLYYHCAAHC